MLISYGCTRSDAMVLIGTGAEPQYTAFVFLSIGHDAPCYNLLASTLFHHTDDFKNETSQGDICPQGEVTPAYFSVGLDTTLRSVPPRNTTRFRCHQQLI